MKRRWIPWIVVAALVAIGAGWWWEVGRPQQQALEIADILSERDSARLAFGNAFADKLDRLWCVVRGRTPMADVTDRKRWALSEVYVLAKNHPSAIARAARVEPDDYARNILVVAIRGSDAFRRLPLSVRVDEVMGHYRTDADLTNPEVDALLQGRSVALPELHTALRQGNCRALRGLALLHDGPAPGEIADALGSADDNGFNGCRADLLSELHP